MLKLVYTRLDSIVIGPGLGRNIVVLSAVAEIIKEARLAEKRYSAEGSEKESQRET
jgi:NAD(P)H-hydrate repair Nnr-like enzyme with NAD(P)H-hydrate dehydratase domain